MGMLRVEEDGDGERRRVCYGDVRRGWGW